MFLQRLDLTTALRPVLIADEALLFLQDAVGLYEGKYKIPNFQNGHVYLTSHRVCYVDNERPREYSAAINLQDVDRYEYYAGFLKSSPKVVLFPKVQKRLSSSLSSSPALNASVPGDVAVNHGSLGAAAVPLAQDTTWICPICSFSNPVPSNFDPTTANANTPLPPCLACGVTPPLAHIVKAAIPQASHKGTLRAPSLAQPPSRLQSLANGLDGPNGIGDQSNIRVLGSSETSLPCPRCTFLNHPSLSLCEICGARLHSRSVLNGEIGAMEDFRPDSPGPFGSHRALTSTKMPESIKFSFRAGGDKLFYERLKGAMVQRKWVTEETPPTLSPNQWPKSTPANPRQDGRVSGRGSLDAKADRTRTAGLAGLERRDLLIRQQNELVIGNAFEDLEALMASAKELVALAERLSGTMGAPSAGGSSEASMLISQSATALGLAATKDILGSGGNSESLYLSELSRNLAEFLTDDATGVLRREGGIMSLVDLWAVFNRARGGVELVSPLDFHKAASLWEKLNLSLRLREFKSGLLVVQSKDRSDEKTISSILCWLKELREASPRKQHPWDFQRFGKGVSPQEAAERFGWSVGVASEELQMAEEKGALCREEGVEGLRFWENWLVKDADLLNPESSTDHFL